ncbi:MAG: PQQ-binding-like beta-propeller repeat protein, partial [Brevinematales bacterium]
MSRFLVVGVFLITFGWGQTLLWQTNLNSLIVATPTAYNGNIYVATYKKEVLAFSPEGNLLFRVVGNAPFTSSPLVLSNYLYITSLDGVLYAIDAENGTILWKVALTESFSSPIASRDNILYIGSVSNTLYAVSANNGTTQWYAFLKGSVYSRPLVDEESVYVVDFGGCVSRFDRKGQMVWQTNLGGKFFASPVKWNNLVFIGSSTGNLSALTTTGTISRTISNTKTLSA